MLAVARLAKGILRLGHHVVKLKLVQPCSDLLDAVPSFSQAVLLSDHVEFLGHDGHFLAVEREG